MRSLFQRQGDRAKNILSIVDEMVKDSEEVETSENERESLPKLSNLSKSTEEIAAEYQKTDSKFLESFVNNFSNVKTSAKPRILRMLAERNLRANFCLQLYPRRAFPI